MSSNLPPGVTDAMIDTADGYDRVFDTIGDDVSEHGMDAGELLTAWRMGLAAYLRGRDYFNAEMQRELQILEAQIDTQPTGKGD